MPGELTLAATWKRVAALVSTIGLVCAIGFGFIKVEARAETHVAEIAREVVPPLVRSETAQLAQQQEAMLDALWELRQLVLALPVKR